MDERIRTLEQIEAGNAATFKGVERRLGNIETLGRMIFGTVIIGVLGVTGTAVVAAIRFGVVQP